MFKDKRFCIRKVFEVIEDLEEARSYYSKVERIFLADGDALILKQEDLLLILAKIRELFPECGRVGVYGSPQDVLRKGVAELAALKEEGLGIIYIGAESGSDKVLKDVKKGATAAEIVEAIKIIESSGINSSVTFISGLAGANGWREHAEETGKMISEAQPSYVGLLTLMVEPMAPIYADIKEGRFKLLSAEDVIRETLLLLENVNVSKDCIFRSNHASNYLSLKGTLPADKERMITELSRAMDGQYRLKDERLRML